MNRPTITHNNLNPAIGREAAIRENGLTIYVRVIDAKSAWGSVRLLVTPERGHGETWVAADRVILREAEPSERTQTMERATRAVLESSERAWRTGRE